MILALYLPSAESEEVVAIPDESHMQCNKSITKI